MPQSTTATPYFRLLAVASGFNPIAAFVAPQLGQKQTSTAMDFPH